MQFLKFSSNFFEQICSEGSLYIFPFSCSFSGHTVYCTIRTPSRRSTLSAMYRLTLFFETSVVSIMYYAIQHVDATLSGSHTHVLAPFAAAFRQCDSMLNVPFFRVTYSFIR